MTFVIELDGNKLLDFTDATAPPEALHRSRTQIEQARAIHLYLTELQTAGNGHRGFNVRSEYIGRKSVR